MGYKAEIKRLNGILEVKKKQTDILYAALKMLVMEKGAMTSGSDEPTKWTVTIPQFDPGQINLKFTINTEPVQADDPKDDKLIMTVTENEVSATPKD